MSGQGHSATELGSPCHVSGLPPLATELRTTLIVRFVPIADIGRPEPDRSSKQLTSRSLVDPNIF
jgi:hypothetical protein